MKKDIRMSLIILGTMASSLLGSGFANAAVFPISGNPTSGIVLDNGQHCSVVCIYDGKQQVRAYIDANPVRSAEIFFNADTATQNAIKRAYNEGGSPVHSYNMYQAQVMMSQFLPTNGVNGEVTYNGNIFRITNGTFTVDDIVGIVDSDLNYRLSNNNRGNLKTSAGGITRVVINGVVVYPIPAPTVTLNEFSPSTIQAGQHSMVSFTSTNANSCTGTGIWNGNLGGTYTPTGGKSTANIYPSGMSAGTYTQTITCTGSGGQAISATRTLTVTALAAPEVTSFTASPTSITSGQSSTLTWASTNADSCVITNNTSTDNATIPRQPSASLSVFPTTTTVYTIRCSRNSTDSSAKTVTVTVGTTVTPPEVTSFTASPTSITSGQSSTLTWTSTNTDKCTIGGVDKATSGTMTVSPTSTTTYTIVCSKGSINSSSKDATVTVSTTTTTPVVSSFTASPTSIAPNQSSTLTWVSTNADSCVITNNTSTDSATIPRAPSGTLTVFPGTTTKYTIVCSRNSTNSSSKDATVTVSTTTTTPVVSLFTASPTSITAGQSSTLTWASTNADACLIGNNISSANSNIPRQISGSLSVFPTVTTTYNIVCSKGTVNSISKSVTITVIGTVSSTNPYARFLTAVTVTKLDTWITTKIVARSSTLTATNYGKFIDGVITALYKIKSETPTSNKNKRYMINYLIFSLQQIQDGIDDEDDFLNGLL